jgi:hypothetical protein
VEGGGMDADKKKSKLVHVKVTDAERKAWQLQAMLAGMTLADFIRQAIGAKLSGIAPRNKRVSRRADPLLLAALGRVGNNLNQLARWVNTHKSAIEVVLVLSALVAVEKILLSYCPAPGRGEPQANAFDVDVDGDPMC